MASKTKSKSDDKKETKAEKSDETKETKAKAEKSDDKKEAKAEKSDETKETKAEKSDETKASNEKSKSNETNNQIVESHENGWAVRKENSDRATETFDTRVEAVGRARELVRGTNGKVFIYREGEPADA